MAISLEEDYQEFMDWFLLQSKEVQKNARVVSNKDLGIDYMLHIDKNTPKAFVPMMPWSAGDGENCTTARICVCPTIVGCIIGYGRLETDYLTGPNDILKRDPFRGGYDICRLDFDHCLRVNSDLATDADRSEEHWLVGYKKTALQSKPVSIGKFFIDTMETISNGGKSPLRIFTGYLTHDHADGLRFTNGRKIKPGYYKFKIELDGEHAKESSVAEEEKYTIVSVDREEFYKKKIRSASLLSMDMPKFANW